MSGLPEYEHVIYGTARATIELPAGRVEVSQITNPDEFATDRVITPAEYEQLRSLLRQMTDCLAYQSDPRGLVK